MGPPHIGAEEGQIAKLVLMPGDPLRAERIALEHLNDATRFNTVRGMLGYTGHDKSALAGMELPGNVSVMGSGMGMPSLGIYVNELFDQFGVETIVRVGTCGAYQAHLKPGDIVIAQAACSDSNLNRRRFKGLDFAPIPNPELFVRAVLAARERQWKVHMGNILSTDVFYQDEFKRDEDDPGEWQMWADAGILAVEMESAELFTLAARRGKRALSILTVSDVIPTKEHMSPRDRELCFPRMVELALAAALGA